MEHRYRFILPFLLIVTVVVVTKLQLSKPQADNGLTPISFRNPIPPITTGQTPLFLGEHLGFFADEGIDLTLKQGSSERNPIKMVAAGKDQIGMIGGPDALIIARSKGVPIKAIAVLHRNANFVSLITLPESGISQLQQLNGQTVGFFYGHISTDVLRSAFALHEVNVKEVNAGFDYNKLLSGELSAQWAFSVRAALQLPMKGHNVNVIKLEDYGINTHGYTIFAHEDYIDKNKATIQHFLQGLVNSIKYAKRNQNEGIELLMQLNPSLDRNFAKKSESIFQAVTSSSEDFPIGYMDKQMFANTYERLKHQGLIENEFNIEEIYTTEFIDKTENRVIR